jgi:hypothetical protein
MIAKIMPRVVEVESDFIDFNCERYHRVIFGGTHIGDIAKFRDNGEMMVITSDRDSNIFFCEKDSHKMKIYRRKPVSK